MRYLLAMFLVLSAYPAMSQTPMGNVSRTITENAVQSTSDAVGKAAAAEQQQSEAAKKKAAEEAEKKDRTAGEQKPPLPPTPPLSK
ncbi:hypothetical protein [Magnetospirillum sp. XM-1]|uniref:hypothetical protein n=1 Tax=Magnetospirillum sp. XM-1 TaxID=1663591 RepID=UPI0008389DF5|nr:hypothetical protein [Magnetospirillum sp. XM-1]